MNKVVLFLIILAALVAATRSQTMKIVYKVSARNLPAGKKVFAEINKDRSFYCRTESIESQTPLWSQICEITHPTENRIYAETRNQRTLFPDESLGWSYFDTVDLLQNGKEEEVDIANDGQVIGKMKVSVVYVCDVSESDCVLKYLQTFNTTRV